MAETSKTFGIDNIYESTHPCSLNQDRDHHITFPGAIRLIIKFDSQCNLDNGNHFLKFYKKEGR